MSDLLDTIGLPAQNWRQELSTTSIIDRFRFRRATLMPIVLLVSGVVALMLVAAPFGSAHADHGDHIEVPAVEGRQFLYPTPSWVAANDHYYPDSPHIGSADLAAPVYTPIYPARAGTVVHSGYSSGSYGVRIEHEDVGDHTYVTGYGHFVDEPLVDVGDEVDLDTPIGYLGQTGNANWSGPHIHFTIWQQVGDERNPVKIPELDFGDWVDSDDYIFGDYKGLDPITEVPERPFTVESTDDELRMYENTTRNAAEMITQIPEGEVLTVTDTHEGQYLVDYEGETGWVAHSGTRPVGTEVFGVEITASNMGIVRDGPGSDSRQIGVVDSGLLLGYDRDGGWRKVLWPCNGRTNRADDSGDNGTALGGCPGRADDAAPYFKYGWVGPAIATEVADQTIRTRVMDLEVYRNTGSGGQDRPDCPCNPGSPSRIGTIDGIRVEFVAEAGRNGWYQITYGGETAWVKGWYTAGPQSTRPDRQ